MKIGVYTLGCKVNQYESAEIITALASKGHEATSQFVPADLYIINTCSVTSEADRKSRQMVARVHKQNAMAKVIIIGCSSENSREVYANKDSVVLISGTKDKTALVLEAVSSLQNQNQALDKCETERVHFAGDIDTAFLNSRARAYLKIQDGCNNFCSYCIVPYLRGRSQSRRISDIVEEALKLSATTEEIVLTGINISAFSDDKNGLSELVAELGKIPVRKRLGSLECGVITENFLRAMKEADFCDHFHLSLQSGSNRILKLMNRHYSSEAYKEKVDLIRKYFPLAGITTDIIVGFPEETDEDFFQTVEFVKLIAFSDIHVFPYSKRSGTTAAKMVQVDKNAIAKRVDILTQAKQELKIEFLKRNLGRSLEVFIEDGNEEYNEGYTSNYIKVYSKAPKHSFLRHSLVEIYNNNGIKGELN